MNQLMQDIQYGIRTLKKNPGFTIIAILTLGFGMAANTTIFSIVNFVLLRPMPVPHPAQIVVLAADQKNNPLTRALFSYPDFLDYRKNAENVGEMFAYELSLVGLAADGHASHFVVSYVSSNYFSTLAVQPALGRLILPTEGQVLGADPVLVLGYTFWRSRFAGDPGVVGKHVLVNGHPMTIIGVAPKGFYGTYSVADCEGYIPLSMASTITNDGGSLWTNRSDRQIQILGRLKPGVSVKQAEASLNLAANQLAQQYPDTNKGISIRVFPERLARPDPDFNNPLPVAAAIFLALAGLVMLLACFNIANVLLVRATVRQREMAIRAALGAKRGRLVRQFLTESLLLAFLGGAVGALLAFWAGGMLSSLPLATELPIRLDFNPDGTVLLYALAAVVITGIIVGIVPAMRVARTDVSAVLHEGGRGSSDGPRRHMLRNILVGGQVAGSLVLLVVAGLAGRNLMNAQNLNLGFQHDHILNLTVDADEVGYSETQGRELYLQAEQRLSALPGAASVTQANWVPMGYYSDQDNVYIEGHPIAPGEQPPTVMRNKVLPNYFDTLRIQVVRGRAFAESDSEKAPMVAVINQTMAKTYWPNEDPLGKRFSMKGPTGPFVSVVGIVGDSKYRGPGEDYHPLFYLPLAQRYDAFRTFQIRTSGPPDQLAASAVATLHDMAPNLPVFDVQTMTKALEGGNGLFLYRFGAALTLAMGLLGLVLAIVGVYSVVSYAAAQRTHEIGIRMALGANRREILRMILRQGLTVVGIGVVVGLVAAFAATRVTAQLFAGVKPTDPLTYAAVIVILVGIAVLACWIPAHRATRVDPLVALRHE